MSAQSDAFISVPCKCPVCERDSRQRYVKSKLYTPVKIESDQHVVEYRWESPRYEGIRPGFYHIWHCTHCHFCDEKEVFRGEDDSGGKLELIREKLLIGARAPGSFLTRMGEVIDLVREYVTIESALAAHLQATYIQEMLSPNMRQYQKLGKFYLRTAWLYREKKGWQAPEVDVPAGFASYQAFYNSLRDQWPDLPLTEEEAIDKAVANYQADLDRARRIDDVRYDVAIYFLLTDLHRRRSRREEALGCVRAVFQAATRKRQATRQALEAGVSKGKGTQQQIESMRSLISWLNNAIERATTLSEEVNDEIFREEYPAAREEILAMARPTSESVLAHLQAKRFHEVTCRRIVALFKRHAMAESLESIAAGESGGSPAEKPGRSSGFWGALLKRIVGDRGE